MRGFWKSLVSRVDISSKKKSEFFFEEINFWGGILVNQVHFWIIFINPSLFSLSRLKCEKVRPWHRENTENATKNLICLNSTETQKTNQGTPKQKTMNHLKLHNQNLEFIYQRIATCCITPHFARIYDLFYRCFFDRHWSSLISWVHKSLILFFVFLFVRMFGLWSVI